MDDPLLLNLIVIGAMAYSTKTDHQILTTSENWCLFLVILVFWPAHPLMVAAAAYLASEHHAEILREARAAEQPARSAEFAAREAAAQQRAKEERAKAQAEKTARDESARKEAARKARERAHAQREKDARDARAREEAARNTRHSSPEPVPPKFWWVHLGVHEQATKAEIKSAYRKLSKELHPDSSATPDVDRFNTLTEAYDIAMRVSA